MPEYTGEDLGFKPHMIKPGDGKGGWIPQPAELRFLHRGTGKTVMPFGAAQMDNGEVILLAAWHDGGDWREGKAEHPVVSFSKDYGRTWTDFETIGDLWSRPMMLTYLGRRNLSFFAANEFNSNGGRYFSSDYGRTWTEQVSLPPASNGRPWYVEGSPLVDRDSRDIATRIAEVGMNYGEQRSWVPGEPTYAFLRWSYDCGRTWANEMMPPEWQWQEEFQGKIYTRSVSEGSLVRAANGWLVAALRTDIPPRYWDGPHGHTLEGTAVSISKDDGKTWSPLKVLYDAGRHHAHPLLLPNGDIVMTLIVRVDVQDGRLASYRRGCEAILSHDNGLTWDLAHKYILDDWEFTNGRQWFEVQCGHLCSTLLDDGHILTAYGNYLVKGACLIRWKPAP